MHVCACIVCMCMYFSVCISSRFASQIFLEENMSKVLPPPSHDKLIFAGWSMYVCVCIACMCIYRMYMSVLYELMLYWLLLQRQAPELPPRPLMTVSCGGTRLASLRAPQVMGANTFFLHPCPLRQPDFAHPPSPPV